MDEVIVIQLIKTTLLRRGKGIEGDPVRIIEQYWDFEGNLVFEYDSLKLSADSSIYEINK